MVFFMQSPMGGNKDRMNEPTYKMGLCFLGAGVFNFQCL